MLPRKSVVLTVLLGLFDTIIDTQENCFDNLRYLVKAILINMLTNVTYPFTHKQFVFKTVLGSSKQTLSCFNDRKN